MVDDERDGVRLTSLDQPLGDGLHVTKGDLVDYLDTVADRLVPLLAGRTRLIDSGRARRRSCSAT
jgi:bifunctional non-homologous end joining protein LigD